MVRSESGQSRPDSGLGFHMKVLKTFQLLPIRSEAQGCSILIRELGDSGFPSELDAPLEHRNRLAVLPLNHKHSTPNLKPSSIARETADYEPLALHARAPKIDRGGSGGHLCERSDTVGFPASLMHTFSMAAVLRCRSSTFHPLLPRNPTTVGWSSGSRVMLVR